MLRASTLNTLCGNPYNTAPEVFAGHLSPKSDVFSFGMLFAHVIVTSLLGTGKPLLPANTYSFHERFKMVSGRAIACSSCSCVTGLAILWPAHIIDAAV